MHRIRPLPGYLSKRLNGWRATDFNDNRAWYASLAERGQHPRAMVVSCCDSRVDPMAMFGAEPGDFFLVRNVANLIPPYAPDHDHHGTSAAIEYAVKALGVAHIVVMGHSGCGGVEACFDMCSGAAPELMEEKSFIGRWMDILAPGFEVVKDMKEGRPAQLTALEHQGVLVSVDNLLTFPFVQDAINEKRLSVHGIWVNIASGEMHEYHGDTRTFDPV
ncbi:carbonic anhydrase [Rubricella aquisinus]|uniref:Carbonic anhydrase n=1 Tax=Rubricella aquisinus TaxID=2028108 RepID=A0A840WJ68_9RHOB|nr:carbonic anhydrase [Rubricella aquisinus]MBB5514243.1 carbonic anhydrase [Rubricella aquisinus]